MASHIISFIIQIAYYKMIVYKNRNTRIIIKELERDYKVFLEGHKSNIRALAITSDNKYIVSGSADMTIRIWNLLENRQEGILAEHTSWVTSIAITSDNKYAISSSYDSTVRIWNLLEMRQETILRVIAG